MARFSQNSGGSGSGSALNYVQIAGGQATITSAPSSIIDLDITTTGKPVQISVTGEGSNATAGSWIRVNLFRDGVAIGNEIQIEASATSENVPYAINFIDDVAAGTYNYSIRATDKSSGNWTFGEIAGPVMNAVELTGFKGDDGADGIANLVVPFSIKDSDGANLLTFEQGGTGVTRIDALQDDLALRSARDIILYPGDDGPGNVYINWGDATISPDATNRVATIADIQSANTGDITFVDNTISSETGDDIVIQNKNNSDVVKARITLDQSNEQVLIEALRENDDWFNDTQWDTAVWSGSTVSITNTPDVIAFFDTVPGNVTRVSVNDGPSVDYSGASYGSGNITIDVGGTPSEDPLTVTEIRLYYSQSSKMDIDYDNGSFDIVSNGMSMLIDSSGDLEINARDEDIDIRANDDVRFTANWNNGGTEAQWRMSNTGRFELPGAGYIENPDNSSGDGYGNDTLKLVPDADLESDQYLIIDPTSPNHIHIRAGGVQDESSAHLILGGERNSVIVSDSTRAVAVTTRPPRIENVYGNSNEASNTEFMVANGADIQVGYTVTISTGGDTFTVTAVTENYPYEGLTTVVADGLSFVSGEAYTFVFEPPYTNLWQFTSEGVLNGPAMGGVKVPALANQADGDDLLIYATGADINIQANDAAASINITSNSGTTINTLGGDRTWNFADSGVLYGPTEPGWLQVSGIYGEDGTNTNIMSQENLILSAGDNQGVYINNANDGLNEVATIGDVQEATQSLNDSGWVGVTNLSNSYVAGSVTPGYRKLNGVVYMRGNFHEGTAGEAAFVLPEGFRPDYETVILAQKFGTSAGTYVTITASGQVISHDNAAWLSGISFIAG